MSQYILGFAFYIFSMSLLFFSSQYKDQLDLMHTPRLEAKGRRQMIYNKLRQALTDSSDYAMDLGDEHSEQHILDMIKRSYPPHVLLRVTLELQSLYLLNDTNIAIQRLDDLCVMLNQATPASPSSDQMSMASAD